jgi:hypothetical protein
VYTVVISRAALYDLTAPPDSAGGGIARVYADPGGGQWTTEVGNAAAGTPLRFTVKTALGYELEGLTTTGLIPGLNLGDLTEDGEGGWYADFSMPAAHVSFEPGYRPIPATPGVLYVSERGRTPDKAKGIDGTSWGKAVTDLQWLIEEMFGKPDAVFSGTYTEIWIEGTVHPESRAAAITDHSGDRNKSFVLVEGLKLYGGFAGTEWGNSQAADPAQEGRDKRLRDGDGGLINESVLSGNMGRGLRSFHVVIAAWISGTQPELHDLSIRGAHAAGTGVMTVKGESVDNKDGGGLYVVGCSPVLENLRVEDNAAVRNGGGAYIGNAYPPMDRVSFTGNRAGENAGGLYYTGGSTGQSATWKNTAFIGNTGNGLYVYNSGTGDLIMEEAVFRGNSPNGSYFVGSANYTVLITKGIWEQNREKNIGSTRSQGHYINLIIKDGVFEATAETSISPGWGSSLSLINVSVKSKSTETLLSHSGKFVLINVSILGNTALQFDFTSGFLNPIYNSRILSNSSEKFLLTSTNSSAPSYPNLDLLGKFIARKSIIGGAATTDSFLGIYKSTTSGQERELFPGCFIQTQDITSSCGASLDMTDFVTTEHDQGDDQYYPDDAQAFDDAYYGGVLSGEVVNALQKDWDKDLAGNDRICGDRIDVGPYETQE